MNQKHPPHFFVIPSLSCPAECIYCFGPNTGPSMDIRIVEKVTEYIAGIVKSTKQDKINVTLHGGEPLAAGFEIIEKIVTNLSARFEDIDIGIQSNLWLLDEKYCELFKIYNVSIGTSLDGQKEINDRQRGTGNYEKTMNGIRLARSYGINVSCIATFTAINIKQWKEIFDFFLMQNLHFAVHPLVPSIEKGIDIEISPTEYYRLTSEMLSYYIEHYKENKVSSLDQFCNSVVDGEASVCSFRDCFGMFLAIDPYGDIYSCQRFAGKKEYRIGNIDDNPSITDLFSCTVAKMFLEREHTIAINANLCRECEHYSYCKGGCAYNALAGNKSLNTIDPLCEAYKLIFTDIKDRISEEMASEENLKAIINNKSFEKGNLLLQRGKIIELTKQGTHPYHTARTAKKIIAAYELGNRKRISDVVKYLVYAGISKTEKSALQSLRALQKSMESNGQLNKIYIHVTWNCQLKCSHCYAACENDIFVDEMKLENIEKIAEEATSNGFKAIVLTGGEPLMHQDIERILRKLAILKRQIKPVSLILRTNLAMSLTVDDYIRIFKAFDEIVVSLDGGRLEHDLRRGEGSYDKVVRNLELYSNNKDLIREASGEHRLILKISATLKTEDILGAAGKSVKELAGKLSIDHVKFRPVLPLGRAKNSNEEILSEPLRNYMSPMEIIRGGFKPITSCGIGQNLYVEPSGEAFPCYAYHGPNSFLGNVVDEGIAKIISSEKFEALQKHTVDTSNICSACKYRYLCGGGCKAWSKKPGLFNLDDTRIECKGHKQRAEEIYQAAREYLLIDKE